MPRPIGFALLLTVPFIATAGNSPSHGLSIGLNAGRPEIRLTQPPVAPLGGTRYRLTLEASNDFQTWSPQGELIPDGGNGMHFIVPGVAPHRFFRVQPRIEDFGGIPDGAELFGYDRIFKEELSKAGFLSPEEFAERHKPSSEYLSALTFDPTSAKYWDAFNSDPAAVNANLPPDAADKRLYDFRLNPDELAVFNKYGFVVSERLGSYSFADIFYRVFSDDFPVFVSADAILHAWHFSYQRMLEEAEETQLAPALQQILEGMQAQLIAQAENVRNGPLRNSLLDADYFLTVARSLLSGQPEVTTFDQEKRVQEALEAVKGLTLNLDFTLFGTGRMVDFSQFKVRGHYERSLQLGRYFQAFMWTALIDFRILESWIDNKPDPQSIRELGTAIVLSHLLESSGQSERWRQLDDVIRLFVGRTDAMNFAQLQPLLAGAGIKSLEAVVSLDQLAKFQQDIMRGDLGLQLIPGGVYVSPFGPDQVQLPRTFVFTGQRFNPDGWSLAQVTFDRIQWNEPIPDYTFFGKVIRRYPSALDMAYSVLGNRKIGWEIAERMLDTASRSNFRDGLPYAHNLTALAATFDRISPTAWEDSIYTRWLAALRELSAPTTGPRFPEAMRTRSWVTRTLNTQLASYTELKHDTVLYAKQPYTTAIILCEYPAGFVEPVPAFWQKMKELADALAAGLGGLPASGVVLVTPSPDPWNPFPQPIPVDLAQRRAARIQLCQNFAQQMAVLGALASKELQQQPFSEAETSFIRNLMNRRDDPYSGPTFDGWYPRLFYQDYGQVGAIDSNGSNKPDPLVTDVHTAPPDDVDGTGGVLHQATGNVDLLLIAVDNGPDRMVYAGPVMSHYEFIVPGLQRLTDSEWQGILPTPKRPARPEWTRSYLVPK